MSDGYFKVYRSLFDNPIWNSEPFTKSQAWIDLFGQANHADGYFFLRGVKIDIKRGQSGRSELTLSKDWKWSRGKVRRFLNWLKKQGMIELKQDNKTTVITICKYELYQPKEKHNSTASSTASSTANRQQTDINNKNKNNKKNNNTHVHFDKFWSAYPKKKAKETAKISFDKINPDENLLSVMINSIKNQMNTYDWQKEDGQFIPLPSTWLNNKRWEDETGVTKISKIPTHLML